MEQKNPFWEKCKKGINVLVALVYFFGAYWFDALCAYVSNEFSFFRALLIMFLFLFALSALLVAGHGLVEKRFKWDLMGIEEFKGLESQKPIPSWRIFKRFKRWMTKSRNTSFWIGNVIIGPSVITILLRRKTDWQENVNYLFSGTAICVGIWVPLWSGIGFFTWKQYIVPFFLHLTSRI